MWASIHHVAKNTTRFRIHHPGAEGIAIAIVKNVTSKDNFLWWMHRNCSMGNTKKTAFKLPTASSFRIIQEDQVQMGTERN